MSDHVNRWIGHASFTVLYGGRLCEVNTLPVKFDALILDSHGITTKTRLCVRNESPDPWATPLGPWIEQLLGRKLDNDERVILEDSLYEVAGLASADVERLRMTA